MFLRVDNESSAAVKYVISFTPPFPKYLFNLLNT